MKRTPEEKLLNPRPGSKIAAAKEFGIDLTLIVRQLRLTPEERLKELEQEMIVFEELDRQAKQNQKANRK
jgi:hypothetical protein